MPTAALQDWLGAFNAGDPVRKVSNSMKRNRVSNILADLQGIGCRIEKPTNGEGLGWRIIVDGSTDIEPDSDVQTLFSHDRRFAIGTADRPGTATQKIARKDVNGLDTAEYGRAMFAAWDSYHDTASGYDQVRIHIPVAATGTPVYILGKTTGNELVWVSVTDTCDTGV